MTKGKHIHSDLIKAWADGAIIQYYTPMGYWFDCAKNEPQWNIKIKYRVKPEKKTPYQMFMDTLFPEFSPYVHYKDQHQIINALDAVIKAAKAGELNE